jgi:hypothetical protein
MLCNFSMPYLAPGIVFQFVPYFIFIFGIEDPQRAALIDQRAAHQNKTVINEFIDELRVLIQKSCSRVPLEKSRFGSAEEIARNVLLITNEFQTPAPGVNFSARLRSAAQLFRACDVSRPVVGPQSLHSAAEPASRLV